MDEDFDFEDSKQDLEDGIDNEKHWKSLSIASAVISVICLLIIVAIILLTPSAGDGGNLEPYSLEELFGREKVLRGRHFNGTWISGHEFLYQSADRNILLYDCRRGTVQPLTTKLNTTSKTVRSFQLSPERSLLLVATETAAAPATATSSSSSSSSALNTAINTASSGSSGTFHCAGAPPLEYFLYDLRNGNLRNLAEELRPQLEKLRQNKNKKPGTQSGGNAKQDLFSTSSSSSSSSGIGRGKQQQQSLGGGVVVEHSSQRCPLAIQTAQWAPRGDLIFVVANDIYRVEGASILSPSSAVEMERLTEDGEEGTLFNGVNDYMYRDLIFSRTSALWFSGSRAGQNNNGSTISDLRRRSPQALMAYLQLNYSSVPFAPVTIYPEGASWDYQKRIRYPTINSPIGEASLWVVDLSMPTTNSRWPSSSSASSRPRSRVEPPVNLSSQEHYITYVHWTADADELVVAWTLRNQKRTVVSLCSSSSSSVSPLGGSGEWRCQELLTLKSDLPLKQLPGSILPGGSTSTGSYLICCQIPVHGDLAAHQLYSLDTKSKVITPYLNAAEHNVNGNSDNPSSTSSSTSSTSSISSYRVTSLLAVDSLTANQLVFFIGESLGSSSGSDSSMTINEEDMRPNVFVFSRRHGTVQCLSCRLVGCLRLKSARPGRDKNGVCLDVVNVAASVGTDADAESCLMQSAHFSPTAAFATITCLVGIVPRVYLVALSNGTAAAGAGHGPSATQHQQQPNSNLDIVQNISLVEENSDLEQRIAAKIIPKVESFLISREVQGGGNDSNGALKYLRLKILTPADFSDSHLAKYPLVFQFGPPPLTSTAAERKSLSPGEYETDVYPDTEWAVHLVTRHQVIFGWLDGRQIDSAGAGSDSPPAASSSSSSSLNFAENSIVEQLDDYAAILDYITSNLTFVRTAASCLYGSNIGGSLVLLTLSSSPSTSGAFNCGLVLSPVVEWRSVNTLLAEQYLDWERFGSVADLAYLLRTNLNHSQLNSRALFVAASTANELVPLSNSLRLLRDLSLTTTRTKTKTATENAGNFTAELPEPSPAGAHLFEPLVNEKNAVDRLLVHYYRQLELFLLRFVISG